MSRSYDTSGSVGGPRGQSGPVSQTISRPTKKRRKSELVAPARPARSSEESASAPIVQAGSVTGRSLTLVISIMCFFACLTSGAVYMINQSAAAWLRDVASEVSIQISPVENVDTNKQVTEVALFLAKQKGIEGVRALTRKESNKLLEPWLGQMEVLDALPVPRLIALVLNRRSPPDFDALRARIAKKYSNVTLDDHRHWQRQIRTVTRSLAMGGLSILLLVGAATTAIIVSATRSALSSNREIVEVLHFVGATDRFIAREFEKHFLTLGIRAGLVGAGFAMAVFFIIPWVTDFLGGGVVAESEMRRLFGSGALDLPGYILLGIVVVVIAALCMLTSRYGVFRILHTQTE